MISSAGQPEMLIAEPAVQCTVSHHAPVGPIRVLVLDDNAFDRQRIRRLSERFQMPVELGEVASIAALAQELARHHYDLILIDYNLPEGTGFEALEIVRDDMRHQRCPIIMVAGDERVSLVVDAMKLGFFDFVSKNGLTVDRLERAIATALEDRKVRASTESLQRREVSRLVDEFLTEQLRGLQPGFQSILHDLRRLRTRLDADTDMSVDLGDVESRLVLIWNLLKASRSGRRLN